MPFVFTNTFYILLGLGLVPISLAWAGWEFLAVAVLYDVGLFAAAVVDWRTTEGAEALVVERRAEERFSLGAENPVMVVAENRARRRLTVRLKDEYPSALRITGPREALVTI